jgi:predicted transcriptional regulator
MARPSTIKELADKGLSLRKVAVIAGVTHSTVDKVLKGERVSEYMKKKIRRIIKHHPVIRKSEKSV